MAYVQGSVVECSGAGPSRCTLRIETVTAYGMSAPPIASGTRTVRLRAAVLDDRTLDALLAEGPWRMTLRYEGPQMRTPGNGPREPKWTLTDVESVP